MAAIIFLILINFSVEIFAASNYGHTHAHYLNEYGTTDCCDDTLAEGGGRKGNTPRYNPLINVFNYRILFPNGTAVWGPGEHNATRTPGRIFLNIRRQNGTLVFPNGTAIWGPGGHNATSTPGRHFPNVEAHGSSIVYWGAENQTGTTPRFRLKDKIYAESEPIVYPFYALYFPDTKFYEFVIKNGKKRWLYKKRNGAL